MTKFIEYIHLKLQSWIRIEKVNILHRGTGVPFLKYFTKILFAKQMKILALKATTILDQLVKCGKLIEKKNIYI